MKNISLCTNHEVGKYDLVYILDIMTKYSGRHWFCNDIYPLGSDDAFFKKE